MRTIDLDGGTVQIIIDVGGTCVLWRETPGGEPHTVVSGLDAGGQAEYTLSNRHPQYDELLDSLVAKARAAVANSRLLREVAAQRAEEVEARYS